MLMRYLSTFIHVITSLWGYLLETLDEVIRFGEVTQLEGVFRKQPLLPIRPLLSNQGCTSDLLVQGLKIFNQHFQTTNTS